MPVLKSTPSLTQQTGRVVGTGASKPLSLGEQLNLDKAKTIFHDLVAELMERDDRYARMMIVGGIKSGKSHAAIYTLPYPILALVFDPNTKPIIDQSGLVEKGLILPRYYFDDDDPENPTAYTRYEQDVLLWKRNGLFKHFASCVVDSFSNLQIAQLRQIAYNDVDAQKSKDKSRRRESTLPQLQDYNVLKVSSITTFIALCSIPCHLVLNAHILTERVFRDTKELGHEDLTGYIRNSINATPALQANIPPLFTEVYLAEFSQGQKEDRAVWKTIPDPRFGELKFGSVLSGPKHLVLPEMPQDFRALFKLTGLHFEDKPALI